jgi:RNA polymerase sigma factor (sigma-70 family)
MRGNLSPTDAQLVEGCLRGDAEAWEQLVRRHAGLVYSVARRFGLDDDDAADVFQGTWSALWEGLDEVRDRTRLTAWLLTVASRLALHQVRRRQRELARQTHELELEYQVDHEAQPEEQALARDQAAALGRAMGRLPQRCRQLLEALFYDPEGPSYAEIAQRLGIAPDSVSPLRRRCLEHLRQLLTGQVDRS